MRLLNSFAPILERALRHVELLRPSRALAFLAIAAYVVFVLRILQRIVTLEVPKGHLPHPRSQRASVNWKHTFYTGGKPTKTFQEMG